jgi:hypothetical protein
MNHTVPGAFENFIGFWLILLGGLVALAVIASPNVPVPEKYFFQTVCAALVLIGLAFSCLEGYITNWKGYLKNAQEKGLI